MTIPDLGPGIKPSLQKALGEWGLALIVLLVALASFGLGRLSALVQSKPEVSLRQAAAAATVAPGGMFVASQTGNVYYYPWCGGAQSIPKEYQVWFTDEKDAKNSGYRPAKNCKGLEQ